MRAHAALALLLGACGGPMVLHGKVLGPDERPVPGATVFLVDRDAHQVRRVETTGDGRYHFAFQTDQGKWLLVIHKAGLRSYAHLFGRGLLEHDVMLKACNPQDDHCH